MWAAWPAARSSLTALEVITESYEVLRSCLRLFYNSDPANPLVTGEGSELVPKLTNICLFREDGTQVCRYSMNNSCLYGGHCL